MPSTSPKIDTRTAVSAADGAPAETPVTGLQAFFARYAWFVLAYNLLVILIGTVVRATNSGDGCGAHWPLCDGQFIPTAPSIARMIEYTHRAVSGLDGFIVLALVVLGLTVSKKGSPVRTAVVATLFFTGVEAWLGKTLVNNGYVAHNVSPQRAVWMAAHLTNTFFLLTACTASAWWASPTREKSRLSGQGAVGVAVMFAFVLMIVLGCSGAITALGDTLYPVRDHADAIAQSLSPGANFLQKLRVLHPFIAGSVGLYILLIAGLTAHLRPSVGSRRFAGGLAALFVTQIAVGSLNVFLKAPVVMQIIHLLMGDFVWITAVLLACAAFGVSVPHTELVTNEARTTDAAVPLAPATWRDYVTLTKPKVISLLLVTAVAPMFMAAGGWPGWQHLVAVLFGGYLAAGAANCINMVVDRDIDGVMKRTENRPTVTATIPSQNALFFGLTLAVLSFALLFVGANLLTAMLALAGLVFYVNIYTLLLKRRTWHNIVIGGAAGAFPPLVGWAAVTNSLSPLAWWLFAIIFLWTPAHFWALAILMKDDYARAKIPMLPVVAGERVTVLQIALYTILTAIVSLMPLAQGLVGYWYVGVAVALNIGFLIHAASLFSSTERATTLSMYLFSMLYLALLFLMLAFDRASAGPIGAAVTAGLAGWYAWNAWSKARKRAAAAAAVVSV